MSQLKKNNKIPPLTQEAEQLLDEMFNAIKPNARYVSQMHVQQYNDSIYKQIINGDIEVSKQRLNIQNSPQKYDIEKNLRKKFMSKAQRQKSELEHRLGFLTNSINSMKKYDQLKAALKSPRQMRASFSGSDSRYKDQQWKKQIQRRGQEIEKRKKIIQQQKKRKQEMMRQSMKKSQQQQKQQKQRIILQHLKAIQNRMKKRQEQYKQANQRYAKVKRDKSMYQRLSQVYQQKQKSLLEERKKKLAQIRNFHQPINQEEIRQHESKFLQLKKQKQQMRERQRRMNDSRSKEYRPQYESSFYRKIVEQQKVLPQNSSAIKSQKMKQFADHVRSNFVPHIDENKKKQIQDLIDKQKDKQLQHQQRQKQLLQMSKVKGIEYLSSLRNLPKKKKDPFLKVQSPKTERIIYKNYLTHHTTNETEQSRKKSWSRILQGQGDKQTKAIKIQYQSQRLQQELKRKQKQARLLKKGDSAQIDQEYFNMIKAKLDLLK